MLPEVVLGVLDEQARMIKYKTSVNLYKADQVSVNTHIKSDNFSNELNSMHNL